jgi:Protein of unknown function (DUF1572)
MSLASAYLSSVISRVKYYKELGDKTFAQLSEPDFYYRPNEASNSIAIIMQHLAGNMLSRWTDFLTTDGEKDWRNRDIEFEEQQKTKVQLIAYWEEGWKCFLDAIAGLKENNLENTIYIRQERLLVIDAINRQLAHYPYHTGQIIYIAKMIKNDNWGNLSIPIGKSEQFNKQMRINK